jgi:hypothetical protein
VSDWVSVGWNEVSKEEPARQSRGHSFTTIKRVTWPKFCQYCGHVALKNGISVLVNRIGCDYERDSRFKAWVASGRKPL